MKGLYQVNPKMTYFKQNAQAQHPGITTAQA
jgi:hypothetical protein